METNLQLISTDELIEEIGKRFECFVFSAFSKKTGDILDVYIEHKGKYYEKLGACADLKFDIFSKSIDEGKEDV